MQTFLICGKFLESSCDHFACKNDLYNYQVDKKLLLNCKGAHMKYDNYLENEKKKQVLKERSRKRKLIIDEIVIV